MIHRPRSATTSGCLSCSPFKPSCSTCQLDLENLEQAHRNRCRVCSGRCSQAASHVVHLEKGRRRESGRLFGRIIGYQGPEGREVRPMLLQIRQQLELRDALHNNQDCLSH
ncbi:hypothetical protein PENTCL1PPCAC_28619 [Pristionchus entomophagus]|uniref:Ferredoxin n=1 Tax=Pristionchus entomophagus TaxID=358040 RepID=A0AAV5UJL2_9BILA|nr:hypothetical protein PENTCL1PPCAC_28619 [Pristionchus entomophagus]